MRTPLEVIARCEVCAKRLDYEIGSILWQHKDHDFCGITRCVNDKLPTLHLDKYEQRVLHNALKTSVTIKD